MPSVTCFNFRFTPNWLMIVLALLFISLFIRLGFWQIQRANEKEQMVATEVKLAKKSALYWDDQQIMPLQYQRVWVKGTYLANKLLLDNQHQQHQFGYNVISPFVLTDGSVILIDRGWIPGEGTRRVFPEIGIPQGMIQLQGTVYFPSKNQWVLGENTEKKEHNVTIIESLEPKLLSQLLQKKIHPFIIRLDKHDAYGFVREWAIVSMPPQRHLAYAVQWFVMAFVILIIFVALNLKKKNEKPTV